MRLAALDPGAYAAGGAERQAESPAGCDTTVFGPRRYTRTTGAPNVYTETVQVPSWVESPWMLRAVNGDADGDHRVSSARIEVNGTQVAGPSDFNPKVDVIERPVALSRSSTLEVTLNSKPGSFLTLSLCGANADHTAPELTVATPPDGSVIGDATPDVLVRYDDAVGAGEPGASGVETRTLEISLDDVDRTSLFTVLPDRATATVPPQLALDEGLHEVRARVEDAAGNEGEARSRFRVDLTPPQIRITEPSPGVALSAESVAVRVVFSDDVGLDLATLVIRLNGANCTSVFEVTPTGAEATLERGHGLLEGANQITAEIRDRAGHRATSGVGFSIDTVAPEVVIGEPMEGSRHGSEDVEASIDYRDEQVVDPETFEARLDGEVVVLNEGPGWARGWLGPLDDGEHELTATISDHAGNPGTAVSHFWVDTTLPTIQVVEPEPASFSNDNRPLILVMFEDAEGIDPETLVVEVDGVDRTGILEIGENSATGELPPELALSDGVHRVFARVLDLAKNEGTDTSEFTIDTRAPEGEIEAPSDPTNESPPTVRITYTDPGDAPSGVDTASVALFVDEADETARLTVGSTVAMGTLALDPPLADGRHTLRVELKDRAGNEATFAHEFLLDTKKPTAEVQSPGIATHDTTPEVRVTFADTGAGVDPESVRLFLRRGDDPEVPLSDVVVTDTSATATVPDATPLEDDTWTLRATVADRAGNANEIQHSFVVDTVAPTVRVENPVAEAFVATATPGVLVTYEDDRSGIDPSALKVWIDGADLTARFTADDVQATGVLEAGDALEDGPHALTVHVFDRAGNEGVVESHPFSVDTVPPMASIVEPAAGYLAASPPIVHGVYSDAGAGIDPLSVRVLVDEDDRTAELTVSDTEVVGTLEPPLADGKHTIALEVEDGAGNSPEAPPSVTFTVDTLPPTVTLISPDEDAYLAQSPATVSGLVEDADPEVAVTCEVEGGPVDATVESGAFSCTLPLTEGANDLVVVARDRFRAADPVTRTVHLDTQPPQVMILQPPDDPFFTSEDTVDVSGRAEDESPIASVLVNGVPAVVNGAAFAAASVPVAGTLEAVATDAAGHTGTATVRVIQDLQPPRVEITGPAEGDWVRGPEIEVTGTVEDDLSPTMVEVNGQPELDPSQELSRTFRVMLSASDGPLPLQARAFDAAGNSADGVPRNVSVDSTPPLVIIEEPATDPLVTKEASVHLAGEVDDLSPITLLVDGQPTVPVGGHFERDVPLVGEGEHVLVATATDAVGLTGGDETTVWVDRTAPDVTVLSPEENDLVFALPVIVQGTVSDQPDGVPGNTLSVTVDGQPATIVDGAWQASIGGLQDGPHPFQIVATDTAGNAKTVEHRVVMDLLPPTVKIESPPPSGTLTRLSSIAVEGTATGRGTITVEVRSGSTTVSVDASGGSWSVAAFPLAEGDNTLVAVAHSESGRTSEPDYAMVTLDTIPPTPELYVPETVAPGSPGAGLVTAVDNRPGVVLIEVTIDGAPVASGPVPLAFEVLAPEGTPPGSTLVVSATATDMAGNSETTSQGVKVAGEGVVVGQVLADETSLPLEGAAVDLEGASGSQSATTDAQGRFRFLTGDAETRVRANAAERTSVEREVVVTPEVGTVMIDARLTPLAEAVMLGVGGGALPEVTLPPPSELGLTVSLEAGVLSEETPVHLTPLSPQGLPALLPLGWSPVAAFDLRLGGGAAPASPPMQATFTGLGSAPVHLVRLDEGTRAWEMEAAHLVATDGVLAVTLPSPGVYALAVPDADPAPEVPVEGMLTGVEMQELPPTAVGEGTVEPSVVPPTGGVARGRLQVQSPLPLPSGTVVQADVIEQYTLASGEEASTEVRREDIVLYGAPGEAHVSRAPPEEGEEATGAPLCPEGALCADFPVAASRTYDPAELASGEVRLDVLAGRESIRGETGGSRALTHEGAGGAIVEIPALALPEDTAVEVERTELSPFLAVTGEAEPLAEVVLDLAGASLATSATLSVEGAVEAGETVVLARVVRLAGVPKLVAVGLGQAAGERIESVSVAGLPGVREEGRYVFYRVTSPMGFATGETTLSGGDPVSAWVEGGGLPFASRSAIGTPYLLPTLAGPVSLQAYAPGPPPLAGQGTGEVVAGGPETAAVVPLVLEGSATTATVTPEDGAVAVPVTAFVELQASAPLFEEADFGPRVRVETAAGDPVPARYLLSGSRTRLAVIPLATLAFSTTYRVVITGLKDTYGADVQVGSSSFTTKDFEAPSFDIDALVFSFPDADGFITITAPEGSFPPSSEVLILNAGNGDVASFQVDNEGGLGLLVPATMRASIDHRLLVTITDPFGNVTTFERSKFVDPKTGETAIGPGGGTVDASDASGVELRIPPGALTKGVHLTIEGRTAEELAQEFPGQTPDLGTDPGGAPLAKVAGGLKITSPETPTFEKPVDLAFPLPDFSAVPEEERPPAESPEDAYYYVLRRVEGPCEDGSETCDVSERKVLFQTIDHAFVECPEGQEACEASEMKVVTASYPFSGLLNSAAAYAITPAGVLAIQPAIATINYLMWTYDQMLPGKALAGVVTGKVLRTRWGSRAAVPEYDPVEGAIVTAVEAGGQRLFSGNAPMAVSQADGTFTLWDPAYVGGTTTVAATLNGGDVTDLCPDPQDANVACATAYEANPADFKTAGLRFHQNIATVNLTLPAIEPAPPPPAVAIRVFRTVEGVREDTRGLVSQDTPVVIGVTPSAGAEVREIRVQGTPVSFRADPLRGEPTGMDWIAEYVPGNVGTYRVEATALTPALEVITGTTILRVIGQGGTNEVVEGQPPEVIPARTVPKDGARGVNVSTFLQIVFTEPVRKILDNVALEDDAGQPVAIQISGSKRFGGWVEDLRTSPDAIVTGLTIQPLVGLRYGTTYTLRLTDGIEDLDTTPAPLVPYETSFETFRPESLIPPGEGETYGSPGIVVLGDRAYLVENHFYSGTLKAYEATDPIDPVEIETARYAITYRPVDIVGEAESPLTGGRLVAVSTGPPARSTPSNVWLLDVDNDASTQWIGAVSLTNSAGDGFINRTFMRNGFLYAATYNKGLQILDLGKVIDGFQAPATSGYFQMVQALFTDGRGFGQENVITIPVAGPYGAARLEDLEAGPVGPEGRVTVVATGDTGLTLADPGTLQVLSSGAVTVPADDATLTHGYALGLAKIEGYDLAVVAGSGTVLGEPQRLVMVVDISNPATPVGLGWAALEDASVTDILIKDDLALLGGAAQVTVVNLTDPTRPRITGTLAGVGGRLALTEDGFLFSTARSVFGGDTDLGGVRTAVLQSAAFITKVTPDPVLVDVEGYLLDWVDFEYRSIPPLTTNNASIEIQKDEEEYDAVLASLADGSGESTWYHQAVVSPTASYKAIPDFRDEDNEPLPPIARRLDVTRLPLTGEAHDRQLEVRFAVPAESHRAYSLRLYAAEAGSTFPSEPTLTLPWTAIQGAYSSSQEVFDDIAPGAAKAREPYVIRRIQRVTVPGAPALRSQEAFALETVFAGYVRYRVSLVEEGGAKREFSRIEGETSYEPQWAGVLDSLIDVGAQMAAGSFFDPRVRFATTQGPPIVPGGYYFYPVSGLVARATLPIKEALGIAKDAFGQALEQSWEYQYLLGTLRGFIDGAVGDYELVTSPIATIEETFVELGKAWRELTEKASQVQLDGFFERLWIKIAPGEINPFQVYTLYQRLRGPIGYVYGYVSGMALWQVASAFAIAAVSAGVGAVAAKIGTAIKLAAEGSKLAAVVARVLRFFVKVAHYVAKLGGQALDRLFDIFKLLARMSAKALAAIEAKYPRAALKIIDPALELMSRSTQAGAKVLEAFGRVAGFPDEVGQEAAKRLINWMVSRAENNPSPAFVEWLAKYSARTKFAGGLEHNRAFKEAVEAATDIPNGVSDEVFEALIAASDDINKLDGVGEDNLVATFVQKHRNIKRPDPSPDPPIATERFMKALLDGPDGPFDQATVNAVMRINAELKAGAWTDEALTGAARLVQANGERGAALLERLARTTSGNVSARQVEIALEHLKRFADPDHVRSFGRLLEEGNPEHVALIMSNVYLHDLDDPLPVQAARLELIVDAIDRLRKTPDGPLIDGVATVPIGTQASSLLQQIAQGASKGFAFEAIGTHRLLDELGYPIDAIVEMGRRFDIRGTGLVDDIVEADAYLVRNSRRTMVDFKHGPASSICCFVETGGKWRPQPDSQLARVVEGLIDPDASFYDEAIFALSDGIGPATTAKIDDINEYVRAAVPGRFSSDPIRVVPSLGGI